MASALGLGWVSTSDFSFKVSAARDKSELETAGLFLLSAVSEVWVYFWEGYQKVMLSVSPDPAQR